MGGVLSELVRRYETMVAIAKNGFLRVVAALKAKRRTVTVIESSCGGLISAGIMKVPGSSAVYHGGSVVYSSRKAKALLVNDALYDRLTQDVEERDGESVRSSGICKQQ